MVHVEVLLTENELAEQFLAALRNRYLPEKFFYWFPLSVRAWLNLCNSAGPYRNFSRSYELIRKHAVEIAHQLTRPSTKELKVVGLGAGQGDKDLLLLEALRAEGARDPTARIAREMVYSRNTVAGWVRRARELGLLPPARRGRAG